MFATRRQNKLSNAEHTLRFTRRYIDRSLGVIGHLGIGGFSRINRDDGTEGPAYDPYGYEEYTIVHDGVMAIFHTGLSEWLRIYTYDPTANGRRGGLIETEYDGNSDPLLNRVLTEKVTTKNAYELRCRYIFDREMHKATGYTLTQWLRFFRMKRRLPKVCPNCGGTDKEWISGYPGETFLACATEGCAQIFDTSFNESAIV